MVSWNGKVPSTGERPIMKWVLPNDLENDFGRVNLGSDYPWGKTGIEDHSASNGFRFSQLVSDTAEIKAYLCVKKTGRLVKITNEKLMNIPLGIQG